MKKLLNSLFKVDLQMKSTPISTLLLMGLFSPNIALAQVQNSSSSSIGRISPEYRPSPILANSFEISPLIDAEVEFVDNLFFNDLVPVDDTLLSIRPQVLVRDRREDRQISLRLSSGYETYLENSRDDRFTVDAVGAARFGLGTLTRTSLGLNFRQNDTRGFGVSDTAEATGQPLSLTSFGGKLGVDRDIGALILGVEGQYNSTNYSGDVFIDGQQFGSGFRDFETLRGIGRLSYSVSPEQRIYTQVSYTALDYDGLTQNINLPDFLLTDRSSDNVSIRAGYTRQLTNVLQLDINAGVISQSFDNPSFSGNDSLAFNANLIWEPTRLTTVQFNGSRAVDTSNDPLFNGLLRTSGGVTVSHELRRNVTLDGNVRLSDVNFSDGDESARQFGTYASVRYFVSKKWSFRLRGEYLDQDTVRFPGSQTRITFGVRRNF